MYSSLVEYTAIGVKTSDIDIEHKYMKLKHNV